MTATATRACAPAATRPNFDAFGSIGDLFNAFFGGSRSAALGPAQGGDIAVRSRSTCSKRPTARRSQVAFEAVERCEHCHGNGAEPGTPIETCARCGGAGQLQAVDAHALRPDDAHDGLRRLPRRRARAHAALPRVPRPRPARAAGAELEVDVPAGIADGQRIRLSGQGHAGEAGAPAGDLYVLVGVREDERFVREGDDLITALDVAAPLAALGATLEVPTLEGTSAVEMPAGHAARRGAHAARARACPRCGAGAAATCAWSST